MTNDKSKLLLPWPKVGEPEVLAKKFGRTLLVQQFENPQTGEILEFSQFNQKNWAICLPITADGKVLYVRQFKHGVARIMVELPAGTAASSEERPEQTMARELLEETGHRASTVVSLGSHPIASGSSATYFNSFLAIGCTQVQPAKMDENEQVEWGTMPLDHWINLIRSGEVCEPSSIVTTMLAMLHMRLGLC